MLFIVRRSAPAAERRQGRADPALHLHLISDSTGETAGAVARAALSQFDRVEPVEHSWALVRTRRQIDAVMEANHPNLTTQKKILRRNQPRTS